MRAVPPGFARPVDAVALGASAGGIDALLTVLHGLPLNPQVPLLAVLHLPPDHVSRLAPLFAYRLGIAVHEGRAHAPLQGGALTFAPPGYHLLVEPDRTLSLSCDPPVHFSRPSIDVLFQSCAAAFGTRLAGCVFTGANEDGAQGLRTIGQAGGLTVVQDPAEAEYPAMPQAAIDAAAPDFILPLPAIRALLQRLLAP